VKHDVQGEQEVGVFLQECECGCGGLLLGLLDPQIVPVEQLDGKLIPVAGISAGTVRDLIAGLQSFLPKPKPERKPRWWMRKSSVAR
jgi:hypothetical protein